MTTSAPIKISATIITFNEEKKLEFCIKSLLTVADEIIVVDSFSTDQTEAICRKYPVRFCLHQFTDYVSQKNYAMALAAHDYILSLDADERLSDELIKSILEVKANWNGYDGYIVKRFNNYCGKWMHFSGWYPENKIRLWDRRQGKWEGADVHEVVKVKTKKVRKLKGHLLHYAYLTVDEHIKQIIKFADMAARAKYKNGVKASFMINVILSPWYRFIKTYFFQLGFLDGYYGFIFCTTSAAMTFFKYVKLFEYNRKGLPENQGTLNA